MKGIVNREVCLTLRLSTKHILVKIKKEWGAKLIITEYRNHLDTQHVFWTIPVFIESIGGFTGSLCTDEQGR